MDGLNAPKPWKIQGLFAEFIRQVDAAGARRGLHFAHAIEDESGQRLGLDDLLYVRAGEATDGAEGRVPKQLGPLRFVNVAADLTGDSRRGKVCSTSLAFSPIAPVDGPKIILPPAEWVTTPGAAICAPT